MRSGGGNAGEKLVPSGTVSQDLEGTAPLERGWRDTSEEQVEQGLLVRCADSNLSALGGPLLDAEPLSPEDELEAALPADDFGHERRAAPIATLQGQERPTNIHAIAAPRMLEQAPPPARELHDDRLELESRLRQGVLFARARRRDLLLLDEACSVHFSKALREQIRGDALEACEQIAVPAGAEQQIAHDEERPSLSHHVQGTG
jgi:hypothetical protein